MLRWFDGNVLSQESRRHISNFLVVTRAWPDADADEGEHSEDMQSDEELFLNKTDLAQALISKMGVGPENRKEKHSTALKDAVDVNAVDEASTETFRKAQSLWPVPKLQQDHIQHTGLTMDAAMYKLMRQSVTASQTHELQANLQRP